MQLNEIQKAAYALIQSDARFLYTLTDVYQNAKNIKSNYIMMCQPYIGVFVDGAAQWCAKVGLPAPKLENEEKQYYSLLRLGHKMFEKSYDEYVELLFEKLKLSDDFFYGRLTVLGKLIGFYYNCGVDIIGDYFCGNTVLCSAYSPLDLLNDENSGLWLKNISIIAGKLIKFFKCLSFSPFQYNDKVKVNCTDYHFYKNCPIIVKNELGFSLFSVLCSINYATKFINEFFIEEIPQKYKFAYLQYYYLCDFIDEVNNKNGLALKIDKSMQDRKLRNALAHYGLGQYFTERDIIKDDILFGLTNKAFGDDYYLSKQKLYKILDNLVEQIEKIIL